MYNIGLSNFTKNQFGPALFLNDIFEENFLKEKESALSPMSLDDTIPNQNNNIYNLTFSKTNSKKCNEKRNTLSLSSELIFDKKKSKKSYGSYGSNIIIISSNKEDDQSECPILSALNTFLKDPKNMRIKKTNKRKRNKI